MDYLIDSEDMHQDRKHTLTEADMLMIKTIVQEAYTATTSHKDNCRFGEVTPAEFMEIVKSHRSFNAMMSDSKRTIRNTFLGILVLIIVGLTTEGFWSKIISKLK